jgi:putative YhgA-like transposase
MTPNSLRPPVHPPLHPYTSLFAQARMAGDLLRGYLREAWVDRLDLGSLELWEPPAPAGAAGLEPVPSLAWRVRWQGGRSWIYLLLAFPTAVDPRLALRLLLAAGRLHRSIEERGALPRSGRLPAVVPVAVYRGEDLWTAPRDLADLAEPAPLGLGRHAAEFRYLLLDAAREPIPEAGACVNLVSALFRLERARTLDAVARETSRLGALLARPDDRPLRLAFTAFLNDPRLPRHFPGLELSGLAGLGGELESPALRVEAEETSRSCREQRRTLARLLMRLLEGRFGPLRADERQKIEHGDPERLLTWGERAADALSLEEVFDESNPPPAGAADRAASAPWG